MIRPWFRALGRKFLSHRQLQTKSRSRRRLRASPRLEALEDRTLTSTMVIEPGGFLTPLVSSGAPTVDLRIQIRSGDSASAATIIANSTGLNGPGLEKILEDIRKLESTAADLPYHAEAVHLRLTFQGSLGQTSQLSSSNIFQADSSFPDPKLNPIQPTLTGFTVTLEVDKPEQSAGPSSPPGPIARLDRNIAPPGADLNLIKAAYVDQAQVPQAGPAAAGEIHGFPPEPVPTSGNTAGIAHPASYPVYQSQPAVVSAPPTDQHNSDLAGSESTGVRPESRQAGAAETLARTEIKSLPADLPDGLLLQRFAADGEQAAFTALVQRYGRFVRGVGQRVLGDSHAAQDVFQATFMVLARKASMVDKENPLAAWLYKVAYHLALRLRAVAARQQRGEKKAVNDRSCQDASECPAEIEKQEIRLALSEELQRLPEKYRVPLVLCYYDGLTHEEAAQTIGMPRGSMAKRIGEGLERLRERLLERGFLP